MYVPLRRAAGRPAASGLALAGSLAVLALGAAIYVWCVWDFATFGSPAYLVPFRNISRIVGGGVRRWARQA